MKTECFPYFSRYFLPSSFDPGYGKSSDQNPSASTYWASLPRAFQNPTGQAPLNPWKYFTLISSSFIWRKKVTQSVPEPIIKMPSTPLSLNFRTIDEWSFAPTAQASSEKNEYQISVPS